MASAEGGSIEAPKAPSEVVWDMGCPLPSRLWGSGERRELPSWVRGGDPSGNAFWRILKATERSSCIYVLKYWGARPRFVDNCPHHAPK